MRGSHRWVPECSLEEAMQCEADARHGKLGRRGGGRRQGDGQGVLPYIRSGPHVPTLHLKGSTLNLCA